MLQKLLLLSVLAVSLVRAQNTPIFPSGLANDLDFTIAKDRAASTLSGSINSSVTTLNVVNGAVFPSGGPFIITIDAEQLRICSRSSNTLTVCSGGRGFSGTTAATHTNGAAVRQNIVAWHHNQPAAELENIEIQVADTRAYNFSRTVGTFLTGDLSVAGAKTITFTANCPPGVAGAGTNHYIRISGGVGTAENVLITGGTCTSAAVAGGTLTFTTSNTHTGSWAVSSATAGLQEAHNALPSTGGLVLLADGTNTVFQTTTFTKQASLKGRSAVSNLTGPASTTILKLLVPAGTKRQSIRDVWFIGDGSTTIALQVGDGSTSQDGVDVSRCRFQSLLTGVTIDSTSRVTIDNNHFNSVTNGIITTANTTAAVFLDNIFTSTTTRYTIGSSGALVRDFNGVTFASLPSNLTNGSQFYVTDAKVTSAADNTCTSGGTGALLVRLNGVHRCVQVTTNTVDKTLTNTYTAGAAQIFQVSGTTEGIRIACATLPSAPTTGALVCDSGASNTLKWWDGSAWQSAGGGGGGGGTLAGSNYSQSFTTQTSVTLAHLLGTSNLMTACYDSSDVMIEPASVTIGGGPNFDVTVTFSASQSGRCVVSGGGAENPYCADAGGSDTYACNQSPTPAAYITGKHYQFKANTANTGTASINFNSLGAKTIKKLHDQTLDDNCIESGSIVEVVYDGTDMQMTSPCATTTGGSSGFVLVQQQTASASATLDFASCISSTYDTYQFEFINILPATDGTTINMRVSTDGGSTYVSTTDYAYWDFRFDAGSAGPGGATGATSIVLGETNGIGNASAFGLVGMIQLYDPGSASVHKAINGNIAFRNAAGLRIAHVVAGAYEANTAVNAVRFLAGSGNITSGTIRCYGLSK